jgi:2-oxo-4-hydroxy-4-carboxy-5-ureidoimidazoline decarboxylase
MWLVSSWCRWGLNDAERRLYSCFASRKWSHQVAARWPYTDLPALVEAAERAWADLAPSDWAEALQGHPRIGERGGSAPVTSEREQQFVRAANADVLEQLADENRRYEARFGHIFLIAAAGKTVDEILAALRERMGNDPVTEARVASDEHRKIARMRLERMLDG